MRVDKLRGEKNERQRASSIAEQRKHIEHADLAEAHGVIEEEKTKQEKRDHGNAVQREKKSEWNFHVNKLGGSAALTQSRIKASERAFSAVADNGDTHRKEFGYGKRKRLKFRYENLFSQTCLTVADFGAVLIANADMQVPSPFFPAACVAKTPAA